MTLVFKLAIFIDIIPVRLLKEKTAVILYVAHDNPAALSVYRNVGFVGFTAYSKGRMDESWKELGFDRSRVELGHW